MVAGDVVVGHGRGLVRFNFLGMGLLILRGQVCGLLLYSLGDGFLLLTCYARSAVHRGLSFFFPFVFFCFG